jgi:hypothetical protein
MNPLQIPICRNCSKPMNPLADMGTIPSLKMNTLTPDTKGVFINMFSCRECGLVELYHFDPTNPRQ